MRQANNKGENRKMSKKSEPKEVVVTMHHHMDPVIHDVANAGNHPVLMKKRNTALNEAETQYDNDGKQPPLGQRKKHTNGTRD